MNEQECRRLAKQVRSFILSLRSNGWATNLDGACAVASFTLSEYLKAQGGEAVLVEGEFGGCAHCWVEAVCDGEIFIVDITASQFGRTYDEVEIVSDPENNEKYVPLNKGSAALESLEDWPSDQKPQAYMKHIEQFLSRNGIK